MSFWTSPQTSPTRKYRFTFEDPGSNQGVWYWIKSVNKPSYEISTESYQIGSHILKYPGVLTWNEVQATIVDTGDITRSIMDNLSQMGYDTPNNEQSGIEKNGHNSIKKVIINQLSDEGNPLETWTLYNVLVTTVEFGDLAYADDDLVELNLTLTYDYATLE